MATNHFHTARHDTAGQVPALSLDQYQTLFAHMTEAFMLGDIVRDAVGRPVDIRVLVANGAFHRLSGLPPEALGRPLRDSLPRLEAVWIDHYEHVIRTGEPVSFASYNADTRRHYEVNSYRPEPGRFAALFRDITARVEMVQTLREQERRLLGDADPLPDFRRLFEHAPGNLLVLTPNFVIVCASNSYLKTSGTRTEDIVGRDMFEAFPANPDDPDGQGVATLRASLERVVATAQPDLMPVLQYDVRRPRAEGGAFEKRYWRVLNAPVPGPDGHLRYIIHRAEEVTETVLLQQWSREQEKRTDELTRQYGRIERELQAQERDLAASAAELRATFEQAGVGIAYVDAKGCFARVNPKLCSMLGYTEAEFARLHAREIVHPGDHDAVLEQFQRALRGEIDSYIAERRYLHKDGHVVWVRITASPLRHPETGTIRYILKFIEDISERELVRAELEGFFRQATVGLSLKDTESRQLRLNQRLCDMLGYRMEELQDQPYLALLHPDDLPVEMKLIERMLAGEIPEYSMEARLRGKDGSYVWVITSATLIRDATESQPVVACVVHDIEARKQLEAELRSAQTELEARVENRTHDLRRATLQAEEALREAEAANRAKSQFLATMSHEIRTPLNGVIGFTGLLLDGPLTEDKRRYAELARQSGESLLHLLNDFLDFSKIEADRLELEPVDFDLHEVLQQVLALVQPDADEKGLELRHNIAVPRRFHGDAARLRQILLNLITNAVKFTKAGHVTLCCSEARREGTQVHVCFEITDTGMGIDPALRAQLFQPFTQANGVSRRFGGTGLGLAICRRLTELMGGEMGYRSKPGKGSTFWAELPFEILPSADDPLPQDEAAVLTPPPDRKCRGRVLVAEDNSVSQQLAMEVFKRLGCQVDVVGNGREAVEAFKRLPYDLILMDCDMPVMDGFEATTVIRALEAGAGRRDGNPHVGHPHVGHPHVPIIAMTASALQGDAERCLAVGMDEFMSKPLRLGQLNTVIATWLNPA